MSQFTYRAVSTAGNRAWWAGLNCVKIRESQALNFPMVSVSLTAAALLQAEQAKTSVSIVYHPLMLHTWRAVFP